MNGYTKTDNPNFNEYFPGHRIAMPPPLSDGAVDYTDGSPKTVQQYAKDVTAFLMWAAEPKLEPRKAPRLRLLILSHRLRLASLSGEEAHLGEDRPALGRTR